MAWLRLEDSLRDHPKVRRLARTLKVERAHARGLLVGLWTWALTNAPDGRLDGCDAEDIAEAAGWEGDADAFVEALQGERHRFLDDDPVAIHDWFDYAESFNRARKAAERRTRQARVPDASGTRRGRVPDASGTRALDETRRDETRRDETTQDATSSDGVEDDSPSASEIADLWAEVCVPAGLASIRKVSKARRRKIASRSREGLGTLDAWREYFARLAASSFLRGINDRGWSASFDWALESEQNVTKVLEGRYDDPAGAAGPSTGSRFEVLDFGAAEASP